MTATPALEVRGARLARGGREVLDGIDFTLEAGTIHVLLGPNGAGKSTLIGAITGMIELDAGDIRVDGRDPRRDRAARRALGLVPQDIALYPSLTARENLTLFGRIAGLGPAAARARANHVLESIGLTARGDDRLAILSGGMRRRLNIAAALVHEPRLVVLDEATVGIDAAAREEIATLLQAVRTGGAAILLATHDMAEAERLAGLVAILVAGRIVAQGSPAELVATAFGTGQDLRLRFTGMPDEAARQGLQAAGLSPHADDDRIWHGRLDGGMAAVAAVVAALEKAGAGLAEARLREPGLAGVYLHVTGREYDA